MIIWFNHPDVKPLADTLPRFDVEIGCNYFYRLRQVDHICAYDWRTRDAITKDTKDTKNTFSTYWTLNGFKNNQFGEVVTPLRLSPMDSGTMAVYLAIRYLKAKEVIVIGCGWHLNDTRSAFDELYSHRKDAAKVSNPKIKLLRTYQQEFGVPIRFLDANFDRSFDCVSLEDLLQRKSC